MTDCCSAKPEKLLCYCFNISEAAYREALAQGEAQILKDFVIWQTKHGHCRCEALNPNKQCCLKDFKKLER